MSEKCCIWKCSKDAVTKGKLYEMPDGDCVWLFYCEAHRTYDTNEQYVQVLRSDLEKAIDLFGQFDNEWIRRLRKAAME